MALQYYLAPPAKNLTDRFPDALLLACRWHAQQRRKISGTPYVAHLLRVTGIVLEAGASIPAAPALRRVGVVGLSPPRRVYSRGRPSPRLAMMFRWISDVPAAMVAPTDCR